jgi:V/A-type H+/Na+-transporting ATPase subunit I
MIVPMKKILLLCLNSQREKALSALRAMGTLHLRPVREVRGDSVEQARNELRTLERGFKILNAAAAEAPDARPAGSAPPVDANAAEALAREAIALREKLDGLEERRQALAREWQPWCELGDFDPDQIRQLEKHGVVARLFRYTGAQPSVAPAGFRQFPLVRYKKGGLYALIGADEPATEDEPVPLPARSAEKIRREQRDLETAYGDAARQLANLTARRADLEPALARQREELRFAEARAGMDGQGNLTWLRGYLPADQDAALLQAARQYGWALRSEEPAPADEPPTLIRHPAWVRPIKSVMDMIGILPGYREADISGAFLLFLSVFFAMIVGDAGYGMIFLALTFWARRQKPAAPKEPFRLLYIMSFGTVIWGLMTGNIFGMTAYPAFLAPLRIEWLSSNENLMLLCFLIGALHLTLAHAWNIVRFGRSLLSLAQAGWIAITWVMFFTARSMILGGDFPSWALALLAAGLVAVVLFMTPRSKLKTEWTAHVMLPLTVIGNFVDVVSYVRLFAVGSASLAVAQAFNGMAIGDDMGVLQGLVAALILFAGHTLNILLCGLGVLVHGVRLNTLEFSGHIGMQWTGQPYRPFAPEDGASAADTRQPPVATALSPDSESGQA